MNTILPGSICAMKTSIKLNTRRFAGEIALTLLLLVVYPLHCSAGEISPVKTMSVPVLSLPDLDGKLRSLDEEGFAGKIILINFWASWCRPCIEEIPAIRNLITTMAAQQLPFAVIGVNVGEAQRRVGAAVKRFGIDYTVLLDRDSSVFHKMGAMVLPTAYVIDGKGRQRYVAQGPVEWDSAEMVELLRKLLKPAVSGQKDN